MANSSAPAGTRWRTWPWFAGSLAAVMLVVGAVEYGSGRLPLGPDGRFGLWEGDIWSSENSQRLADPYAFSHLIHGMIFYGFLWLVARRTPIALRFLLAMLIEGAWEVLENSPIIIERYRAATIALGYEGDSVVNSLADIVCAALGFWFASRVSVRATVLTALAMEIACGIVIRDNLTLNVVMLIHPVEAIKQWQMGAAPLPPPPNPPAPKP